jgi:hypothetical protein
MLPMHGREIAPKMGCMAEHAAGQDSERVIAAAIGSMIGGLLRPVR